MSSVLLSSGAGLRQHPLPLAVKKPVLDNIDL